MDLVVANSPPFAVEVIVFEEDTARVLSAPVRALDEREDSETLILQAQDQKILMPGDLFEQGSRWYAIVHDVQQEPTCQWLFVDLVLQRIINRAEELKIGAICLQALGCYHGSKPVAEFLAHLEHSLRATGEPAKGLRQI